MTFDAVIVGGGFGGLATALALAERGARVALCETLNYAGGCASTFHRGGFAFEAGATLFSGLAPGQLFGDWIERHRLPVTIDWIDPLVELRAGELVIPVTRDRQALVETFVRLGGPARQARIRAFFERQRRVAQVLWELFSEPELLPPLGARALLRHALRLPRYALLLPLLGRSLASLLREHGLESFTPLRCYLDAVCQITVQCPAGEAEAPFALAAIDYFFHGDVGGIPRRLGFASYGQLWPVEVAPGLHLVGDSTFPGQSTLAVAIGGTRVAAAVARSLGLPGCETGGCPLV